jgi:hypothetical protein
MDVSGIEQALGVSAPQGPHELSRDSIPNRVTPLFGRDGSPPGGRDPISASLSVVRGWVPPWGEGSIFFDNLREINARYLVFNICVLVAWY